MSKCWEFHRLRCVSLGQKKFCEGSRTLGPYQRENHVKDKGSSRENRWQHVWDREREHGGQRMVKRHANTKNIRGNAGTTEEHVQKSIWYFTKKKKARAGRHIVDSCTPFKHAKHKARGKLNKNKWAKR